MLNYSVAELRVIMKKILKNSSCYIMIYYLIEQIVVNGLVKLQFTKEKDLRFMQAI